MAPKKRVNFGFVVKIRSVFNHTFLIKHAIIYFALKRFYFYHLIEEIRNFPTMYNTWGS